MKFFGKSGADLIPLLNQGRAGIEENRRPESLSLDEVLRPESPQAVRAEVREATTVLVTPGSGSLSAGASPQAPAAPGPARVVAGPGGFIVDLAAPAGSRVRAIGLDPTLIDAYQALADLMFGVKHLLPAAQLYEEALERAPLLLWLGNTATITVVSIVGHVLTSSMVAFGFARIQFVGRNVLFVLLLSTMMLPPSVTIIPTFILFRNLHWIDTWLPLMVPSFFGNAFSIFLMRQFFMTIPRELEEAARIDGANFLQIITRIIVPLSMPVLTVILILSFKDIWNDFFTPLLYLNDLTKYPLAVGLAYFNGQFRVQMSLLMAASVVVLLPLLIVFFIAQRAFVEGISLTGLAGR